MRSAFIYRKGEVTFAPHLSSPNSRWTWLDLPMKERVTDKGLLFGFNTTFQTLKAGLNNEMVVPRKHLTNSVTANGCGVLLAPDGELYFLELDITDGRDYTGETKYYVHCFSIPIGDVSWALVPHNNDEQETLMALLKGFPEKSGLEIMDIVHEANLTPEAAYRYETHKVEDLVEFWKTEYKKAVEL